MARMERVAVWSLMSGGGGGRDVFTVGGGCCVCCRRKQRLAVVCTVHRLPPGLTPVVWLWACMRSCLQAYWHRSC